MRTTLRIDDDLMRELRKKAAAEKVSLAELCNQVLRQGLASKPSVRQPFREQVFSMGTPRVNLDTALALAAQDEDAEIARKLVLRK
ncbi:MAG: ribbon-helix-helix protein, CopG family [Planctomycetes bacterium]|nr:ribbon-helix-helix protein, CopG family [Planctomycetota bacterium]